MNRLIGRLALTFLLGLPKAWSCECFQNDEDNQSLDYEEVTYFNDTGCTNKLCVSDEDYINKIVDYVTPKLFEIRTLLIAIHSVIFAVGLVGNFIVCLAVYRNHTMRTVTNYFIVNLALADLLVIFFCLPSTVLWDVTETWFLGLTLCKAVPYLQTVSVSVSVMTLTFISIDRWYAICFPLRFKSTTSRAKKAICVIWLVAFIFDIPDLVVLRVTAAEHLDIETIFFSRCGPSWSDESDQIFIFVKFILLYIGPLIFMAVAYYQIVRVLWRSDIPGHNLSTRVCEVNEAPSSGVGNPEGQLKSRRKAAKMLVAVVVMFAICHLPVHLYAIMRQTIGLSNSRNIILSLVVHGLCYANSAINPLIYNFMSGKFRKEFKRAFCCPGNGAKHHRGTYKFTGVSTGRRSQLHTRSMHTTTNNNVQQSVEFIPLSAISSVQQIDKRN